MTNAATIDLNAPALPVSVTRCFRRNSRFNIALVQDDGHQMYFGNCDGLFTRRASGKLSACTTYGQQIDCIKALRAEC